MIHFNLRCDKDHEFDGWFKDSASFQKQLEMGLVSCTVCGSTHVQKALSKPNIASSRQKAKSQAAAAYEMRNAWRNLKETVESQFENVGEDFADEARKIHYGDREERGIYGQSSLEDIKSLHDEGIDILPLPDLDDEKPN